MKVVFIGLGAAAVCAYIIYGLFQTERLVDWQLKNFNPFGFRKSSMYTLSAKVGAIIAALVLVCMIAIILFAIFVVPHL
jgi:hypothetical protein